MPASVDSPTGTGQIILIPVVPQKLLQGFFCRVAAAGHDLRIVFGARLGKCLQAFIRRPLDEHQQQTLRKVKCLTQVAAAEFTLGDECCVCAVRMPMPGLPVTKTRAPSLV